MVSYLPVMLNNLVNRGKSQTKRRRRYRRLSLAEVDQILRDYQDPTITVHGIGQRHKVSLARITWLARRAGLPLRGRGRRPSAKPSARHLEILEAVRHATMAEVGHSYGCSKQRIFQVVDRWRDWMASNGRAEGD